MKIYIEHEVSSHPKYCLTCEYRELNECSLFREFLVYYNDKACKTDECLASPNKVCRCTHKKTSKMIHVDSERSPIWPTC